MKQKHNGKNIENTQTTIKNTMVRRKNKFIWDNDEKKKELLRRRTYAHRHH